MPEQEQTQSRREASKVLANAIFNAELILNHASENGLQISLDDIKVIVQAINAFNRNQLSEDTENAFWASYNNMSKAIMPVSISSIKAAEETPNKRSGFFKWVFPSKTSDAKRVVKRYNWTGFVFLLITLIIQTYALVITVTLTNIQKSETRVTEIVNQTETLKLLDLSEDRGSRKDLQMLVNEKRDLERKLNGNISSLEKWVKIFKRYYSASDENMEDAIEAAEFKKNSDKLVATNLSMILNLYALPILYGLLGGFAFVLRSLTRETKDKTYCKSQNLKYLLRINLGALAGLTIGLFRTDSMNEQTNNEITNLSPLALAFVAGYSIDFLFAAIDRVSGLLGKSPEKLKENPNS